MAGAGFTYTALQASQKGWGDAALSIAVEAQKYEKEKKRQWEKEHTKRVADSYKGIARPEDLTANVEKTYATVYKQVASKITDLNLDLKNGIIGEDEYYSKLHLYQDVPNQLKALSDAYENMEKKLVEGDDVLSSNYANTFRKENYVDGIKVEINDKGMLDLLIPIKDESGNITGYNKTGLAEKVAELNSYVTEPKLSDNITLDAIEFGESFKKSTKTWDDGKMIHTRSGMYSQDDVNRFNELFDLKFSLDSKYVQKQAMLNNPDFTGAPDELPEEELIKAQQQLKETAIKALGGVKSDKNVRTSDKDKVSKERHELRQRVINNLDKAMYNDKDALAYFIDSDFKYNGDLIDETHVDVEGNLHLFGTDENNDPVHHIIDEHSVRGFLINARNNRDAGTKNDVSWDELEGYEPNYGDRVDKRYKPGAPEKVDKAIKQANIESGDYEWSRWDSTISDELNKDLGLPEGTLRVNQKMFSDNTLEILNSDGTYTKYDAEDVPSMNMAKKALADYLATMDDPDSSKEAREKAKKKASKAAKTAVKQAKDSNKGKKASADAKKKWSNRKLKK